MDIGQIKKKSILVIGDVMLDTYYTGEIKRISPEAPVPVFRMKKERSVLGGAANVAANLVASGQSVYIMSIIGNDDNGNKLRKLFIKQGINTELLFSVDRRTTVKTRFLANNNQQVLRLDVEDIDAISVEEEDKIILSLKKAFGKFDIVIISDYLKGFLSLRFTQSIISMCIENGIDVVVDVKDKQFEKYKRATVIKPNLKELQDLTGKEINSDEDIVLASKYLKEKCCCRYVLTTCGARGMVLVGDKSPYFIEAKNQEVFDVTGAGDTTIAYLAACMANNIPIKDAVNIANIAAGIQVTKVGTSSVYWNEVMEKLSEEKNSNMHKIICEESVEHFREEHRNKKIVFTNGCFDILHIGHIRYLQAASRLGDILIVGVNSDSSIKRLKGSERPINSEEDRVEMLSTLGFVDYVTIFNDDTPLNLIKKIQPDILVKGGDYIDEHIVGAKEVEDRGGKTVLLPYVEGRSTTNIIERIKR